MKQPLETRLTAIQVDCCDSRRKNPGQIQLEVPKFSRRLSDHWHPEGLPPALDPEIMVNKVAYVAASMIDASRSSNRKRCQAE